MIYEENFKIGLDDLNQDVELKNLALLKYLEDIAGFHSDSVGMGINHILQTGVAWALLDWEVQVLRRPKYGEDIHIKTWSRKISKCHAYRDFEVYVGAEKCVIATSKWILMDLKKRRPMVVSPELAQKYDSETDKSVFGIEELVRLPQYEDYVYAAEYKVRRSDIDINGHLHNLNYLEIVQDAFSENENPEVDHFRISYKKEILLGQTAKIYRHVEMSDQTKAENPGKICLIIKSEDDKEVHAIVEME